MKRKHCSVGNRLANEMKTKIPARVSSYCRSVDPNGERVTGQAQVLLENAKVAQF